MMIKLVMMSLNSLLRILENVKYMMILKLS